jgi:hypothetical protein
MDQPQLRAKTLAEILGFDKGESPNAQLCQIYSELLALNADTEDGLRRLSLRDQYIWLISCFQNQVANGGIDQFLFNSYGDYVVETLEALAAIGAFNAHRILKKACELFPNGRPSENHETREDQVRTINAKFGKHMDELVGAGEIENNLSQLLIDYWRLHAPPS